MAFGNDTNQYYTHRQIKNRLNLNNDCYNLIQKVMSLPLPLKP